MYAIIMAGLLTIGVPASQQGDTTFAVDPRGRLEIGDLRGDLSIRTWDEPRIRVGVDPDERSKLRIDAGSSIVRVSIDRLHGSGGGVDLELTIPATMAIRVIGTNGDVEIRGAQGEVAVELIDGGIELTGGTGLVSLHTVQGDIEARDARGRLDLNTANGDIEGTNLSGDLSAKSISGDIELHGIDAGSVDVSAVGGDVTYQGTVRDRGMYTLRSHSGDITFVGSQPMNATITVNTFSGDFESDVPVQLTEQERGKRFSFTLGSGTAHVDLESFSGDIRLAKPGSADDKR